MIWTPVLAVGAVLLSTQALRAQDRSRYHDFELDNSVAAVASTAGAGVSEAQTIHHGLPSCRSSNGGLVTT